MLPGDCPKVVQRFSTLQKLTLQCWKASLVDQSTNVYLHKDSNNSFYPCTDPFQNGPHESIEAQEGVPDILVARSSPVHDFDLQSRILSIYLLYDNLWCSERVRTIAVKLLGLTGLLELEWNHSTWVWSSITGESERLKPKNLMLWQWYPWKIHEIHHGVLVMTLTFPWSPKKGSKLPAHRWGPHHEVWKSLIQARCAGHPSGPYPTSGTRPTRWGCWTFWGSFFSLSLKMHLHLFAFTYI